MGFTVTGKLIPETVKPAPWTVAALRVTAADPVDDRIRVCVVAAFTFTLPNDMLVKLTPSAEVAAFSCNAMVFVTLLALAVTVAVCIVVTAETVAAKLAEVAPAATVAVAGTLTIELLLARLTT